MCDLSAAGARLGSVMPALGYDTCLDDGACEECLEEEARVAYCLPTGLRQRVVCAGCHSPNPPLPFCLPGNRLFWEANSTELVLARAAAAASRNSSSRVAASAGLFFRSCSSEGPPRHFLRGGGGGGVVASSSEVDGGVPAAPPTTAEPPSPSAASAAPPPAVAARVARPQKAPDESMEVLSFLALNATLLAASGYSLRRQHRKQYEETMQGLYSHVGEVPDAKAPRRAIVESHRPLAAPKAPERREAKNVTPERRPRGEPSSSGAASAAGPSAAAAAAAGGGGGGGGGGPLPSSSQPPSVVPEMLGRSFQAAAARAGSALELAVKGGEGFMFSQQKHK